MKRIVFFLLYGVISLTLQTTLLTFLPIQRIRPDLVLILILYMGLFSSPISGSILSLLMGFLMDLFSGNSFGLYTLSRPFIFSITHFFKGRFFLESYRSQFLFTFIFSLVEGLFILILIRTLNPGLVSHLYPLLLTFFLPQSLFTALMTPILFVLIRKGSSSLSNRDEIGVIVRGIRS